MNPSAIVALISDLYAQILTLQNRVAELEEALTTTAATMQSSEDSD